MLQLIHAGDVLLPLLYSISAVIYLNIFINKNSSLGTFGPRFLLFTIFCHLLIMAIKWTYFGYFPISGIFAFFSMLAFTITIVYFALERIVHEGRTGIFFLSIVFFFQLVSSLFISYKGSQSALLTDPNFIIHTSFTLLGISSLAIAAIYGFMYIMLAKQIKSHRFGILYDNLPALETLEKMGKYGTSVGIVLLGAGIFLGHLYAYKMLGHFIFLDPKIIISDIAWLAYLCGWIIVHYKKLYGMQMSIISFWGFLIFMLSMMIVNLLSNTFHNFL